MKKSYPGIKGFTLIELLVVVVIIGILAAIALPQYQRSVEKTKAMEGITALKAIWQATQMYELTTGKYPAKFDELDISYKALEGAVGNPVKFSSLFYIYLNYADKEYPMLDRASVAGYRYTLIFCPKDNSIWCGAGGVSDGNIEKEEALCQNIGGIKGTLPAGCATSRSVNYKL
jgi:type II secretion system protein G